MEECKCGARPYREERIHIDCKLEEIDRLASSKTQDQGELWAAINRRIPYSIFFSILSILILVVGGLLAANYSQGTATLAKISEIQVSMSGIARSVENNKEDIGDLKRYDRRADVQKQTTR